MKRLILAVLIGALFGAITYSDDDVAQVFIKKAQDLAKKKEYKEALANFRKAIAEAPNLVDGYFCLGEMYRDIGESEEAATNFSRASEMISEQEQTSKLKSYQSKIDGFFAEYNKVRQELDKANEQLIKSLMPLIDKYQAEDIELAVYIIERAFRAVPNDEGLQIKRKELAQKVTEAKKATMKPLFNGNDLDDWDINRDWSVRENCASFVFEDKEMISASSTRVRLNGDYNIIARVKQDSGFGQSNILALGFGFQSLKNCYVFGYFDGKLLLGKHTLDSGRYLRIKEKELPDVDISDWNELEVEVAGKTIRCYLNGELCFEATEPNKDALSGVQALIGNNCSGQFKDILYSSED
ncbi:MAG: family 16 glycoside hydrolase [Candidatus Brocadiia bacterium]